MRNCQDKFLDTLGPVTKLYELLESAQSTGAPVDFEVAFGWLQRLICMIGNANTAMSTERRKAILLKIEPKLANMASNEPGASANGLLFGESFVKDLGSYVKTFTALDKAQSSIKRVFSPKVFGGAGGRLTQFARAWSRVTSDSWVLQAIRGYQLELTAPPIQPSPPRAIHMPSAHLDLISTEIRELQAKKAIEEVPLDTPGFVSNLFLVPKKGGGVRPVINLRPLNAFIQYRHFKMEGIHCLRDLLLPGDWMVKLDLQDAYLTIPIASVHRNLLQFCWEGKKWRFTCLPFGLSSAPWCFTKVLKPVVAFLRLHGVRLIIYLDDILILSGTRSLLLEHLGWALHLIQNLGFLVNWKKSVLIPSQQMEFLGFRIDSVLQVLCLPTEKMSNIKREIKKLMQRPDISLRQLARNSLELLAASFAIRSLSPRGISCSILLKLDNVSAVRYINHLGGTRSRILAFLARDFWNYCLQNSVSVTAEHIPGLDNYTADWNSRYLRDSGDWKLLPKLFRRISSLWGPLSMDLFASRLNTQLPKFCSWRPDPEAVATDAFLQDWSEGRAYAFPPFNLIARCLAHLRRFKSSLVLITPCWRSQPWFPHLLEMAIDYPRLLPEHPSLLTNPDGENHPLVEQGLLRLMAWLLSGDPGRSRRFRTRLCGSWQTHGHLVHDKPMLQHGDSGPIGAWDDHWIRYQPL
ncbi:uncharacterized protein LOC134573649 [Pelobates fuscus]|uniref:uncharacterized protein LOC134573649 n=1 Tax=Pelobates fuscus TaxID=191477 RepID=UPI002FE4E913